MPLPAWAVEVFFAEPKSFGDHARKISSRLKASTTTYLKRPIESIPTTAAGALSDYNNLVVAIGPEALRDVLAGPGNAPVLAVFVSKSSFESIIEQTPRIRGRHISAIYSDPDPLKQVALVKALYGTSATSVLISSLKVGTYVSQYEEASKELDVKLNIVNLSDVKSTSNFIRATNSAKTLLLLKDQELFDQISLEKLLLSSYDINRQGVIGYSRGLVKNGGAATTYSSVDNIAHSIYQQVNRINNEQPIDPPHYTELFEVALNKYILRSLDLTFVNEKSVHKRITQIVSEGGDT
ncbi:hypothetical protein [Microbulbifer epialgicus]|uniref:ABC transport system substrate-binding protein n=1 Tax=Microbulbifer epialgicus TaxID=393907 RepID=A0ABV4NUH5_9GAMM